MSAPMDAHAFRGALARHDLTQQACARFLEVTERTVRRWSTGEQDVPRSVVLLFGLMDRFGLKAADLEV